MIHINLQSQYVVSVFGFLITNTFLTSVLVTLLLVLLAPIYYLNRNNHTNIIIKGVRALIFEGLKFADTVTGNRELSKKVLPLVATFFIFILTANLLGLVPGFLGSLFIQISTSTSTPAAALAAQVSLFKSPNSDLSTTIALALFSFLATQYFSAQVLGIRNYVRRFLDFSGPMKFVLGFFELLSESFRIISLSFRLFGNVFAGEVLLLLAAFFTPYILPVPFVALEIFVGVIQAFIFAALTLSFVQPQSRQSVRLAGS